MNQTVYHIPALLPQVIEALAIRPGGRYVDATYGGGGHSRAILDHLGPDGRLFAFDQDIDAIERAQADPRLTMIHANFRYLSNFMRFYGVTSLDGVLADLGVSFHHFDDSSRGFSFRFAEGDLDMRMNRSSRTTAADLLNESSEERLAEIFRTYGELKQAPRLAAAIVRRRATKPFAATADLTEVAEPLLNRARVKKEMAPLFQALRIEVNDEMGALRSFLEQTTRLTAPGGRLAIITYHSLEDRMVKNFIRTGNIFGRGETDLFGRSNSPWRPLGSKPIVPDEAEIEANPRSRSAKLRVAEKVAEETR
ncbi:MAG: 16S rRNA (cytosine(1402)-N(4))-methyltransferase RsmH [Clostridium sp.]|nr:16S rRNA (cytosine(1402)-N(4))-methyltransferase RsmH [Clostridium sp.]